MRMQEVGMGAMIASVLWALGIILATSVGGKDKGQDIEGQCFETLFSCTERLQDCYENATNVEHIDARVRAY